VHGWRSGVICRYRLRVFIVSITTVVAAIVAIIVVVRRHVAFLCWRA
jgi:hypothetical protein